MQKSLVGRLGGSWRLLIREVTAFGGVGLLSLIIDVSAYNVMLHRGTGPLTAKLVSTTISTAFAYFGNRHVAFAHRARVGWGRETRIFITINIVLLIMAELVLALFAYPFGLKHDTVAINVVNLFTIGCSTVFRFWAYKRFVFLHPEHARATAARSR